MTTPPAQGPVLTQVRPDAWRRWRYGLLAAVAALLGSGVVLGSAPSSLADLRAGVADGRVHEVTVSGSLPPGATGFATVSLSWRDGGRNRFAEVVQVSDPTTSSPGDEDGREVVTQDVKRTLLSLDPSLAIVSDAWPDQRATFAGWRVPGWFPAAALVAWFLAVALLVNGPQPWWATRWAWFWMLFSPAAVVTVPVFLLVSGPPPGIAATGPPGRRLTGGWAFLLMCVVGPAFGQLVALR